MSKELITKSVQVLKTSESLGLVFGFSIVSEIKSAAGVWTEYEDLHGDIIQPEEMVKAALSYTETEQIMKSMHSDTVIGNIPFIMPLTQPIAKSFGISEFEMAGMMVAGRPETEYLQKFLGPEPEWTGFSIGCHGIRVPKE